MSEEFENFVATHGIQHRKSPPFWPQANGEVERQNRTLLKSLKVAEGDGKKWTEEFNFLTTPNKILEILQAFILGYE